MRTACGWHGSVTERLGTAAEQLSGIEAMGSTAQSTSFKAAKVLAWSQASTQLPLLQSSTWFEITIRMPRLPTTAAFFHLLSPKPRLPLYTVGWLPPLAQHSCITCSSLAARPHYLLPNHGKLLHMALEVSLAT